MKRAIEKNPEWGLKITHILHLDESVLQQTKEVLESNVVDEVFIAFSRHERNCPDMGYFLAKIEEYGKVIRVFINLEEELKFSSVEFFELGTLPGLIFYSKPLDPDLLFLKRFVDIVGALIGLAFTALLFPFIAIFNYY